MSDEIFVSEKTGKRYKIITHCLTGGLVDLEEIIEPKLEVGDWYSTIYKQLFAWQGYTGDRELMNTDKIIEIRKTSREIWVKKDGQWEKK